MDLLIFEYVPNLKIVGTFHSLNNTDKRTAESEFDFCYETALKKEKKVYFVDISGIEFIKKLISSTKITKIKHLLSMYYPELFSRPKEIKKIIQQDREKYMIDEIEKNEGSIKSLKTKGILVVGSAHAKNYYKRVINQL